MSDARKLIADVVVAHEWRGGILGCGCGWNWPEERTYFCGEDERIARAHAAHVAAEIHKALGGLTPDIRYGGAYHRIGTEQIWREKHETRWVSGWSEVQS
ncbi:hypothetical protein [Mycolicibacterium conceptionense]|uniref:hypothetical protein n=1 Tax=Mycolicibacterium conceptionense TaxID=451644 RepID=UPI0007ED0995|nr:hypothetical protein [Mycolicibacterium conceptionense]OBK09147.1 hypothetical protein A5639_11900 [Mycolicibacterium conceptionense]